MTSRRGASPVPQNRPPQRRPDRRPENWARRSGRRLVAGLLAALSALAAPAAFAAADAPAAQKPHAAHAEAAPASGAAERPAFIPRTEARRPEQLSPFEAYRFHNLLRRIGLLYARGQRDRVLRELDALISRYPKIYALHESRAALLAMQGDLGEAMAALTRAVDLGLRGRQAIETQPAFAALEGDPGLAALIARLETPPPPEVARTPPPPVPAPIVKRHVVLSEANAAFSSEEQLIRFLVRLPGGRPRGPVSVVEGHEPNLYDPDGAAARLLNGWYAEGRAAGHAGDLYDNLDRGHSRLPLRMFPQLTGTSYADDAKALNLDYSPKKPVDFGVPTLGNSSTARTAGPNWRSMTRLALTTPDGVRELTREYESNQIYVYPEHKDHDPFWGDVFPVNTPYAVTSQGSSGSDRKFLHALAAAMAALRPETKALAVEKRILAPTLQLLLRWSQNHVGDLNSYLSGRAHPTVFDGDTINAAKIAARANAIPADALPPMVRIAVVEEDIPVAGVALFGDGLDERLFDSPSAIARIARGVARDRRMVISAAGTEDPNGRPLTFKWRLLRGDPDKVRIAPLDDRGETAEIVVSWHERTRVPGKPELTSQRVDIGVFADNGAMHSAPAFVSVAFPPRQKRVYDADGRILSVSYDAAELQDRYSDPVLYPLRGWRDDYAYDAEGRPLGWTRTGPKGGVARFTRHGARVLETDALGRPVKAAMMRYPVGGRDRKTGKAVITPKPQDAVLVYSYENDADAQGYATPVQAAASSE